MKENDHLILNEIATLVMSYVEAMEIEKRNIERRLKIKKLILFSFLSFSFGVSAPTILNIIF